MIAIKNSPFELNIKCHTTELDTLVYDIKITIGKHKYTITDLIEDDGYRDTYFTGLDYAPQLDEEQGTFSFRFGDGVVPFRFTRTSKCTIEELN